MRLPFAGAGLLLISCASAPPGTPAAGIQYVTQAECHPEIPILDPRDPHVMAPKVVLRVEPAVPEELRAAREPLDARVIVEVIVDDHGDVTDVCALKGDPRLVQATIAAVRKWKFSPGAIDGKPSSFRFDTTTSFHLH